MKSSHTSWDRDRIFEYTANATKIKGAHNIRFGFDISRQRQNHMEVLPTSFTFVGGVAALNGGSSPNAYDSMADFLLGPPQSMQNALRVSPVPTKRLWQVNRKLTVNYGLRWEYYPVPTEENTQSYSTISVPTGTAMRARTQSRRLWYPGFEEADLTVQREFLGGITAQVGYVGTRAIHLDAPVNQNYALRIGGWLSESASLSRRHYGSRQR